MHETKEHRKSQDLELEDGVGGQSNSLVNGEKINKDKEDARYENKKMDK